MIRESVASVWSTAGTPSGWPWLRRRGCCPTSSTVLGWILRPHGAVHEGDTLYSELHVEGAPCRPPRRRAQAAFAGLRSGDTRPASAGLAVHRSAVLTGAACGILALRAVNGMRRFFGAIVSAIRAFSRTDILRGVPKGFRNHSDWRRREDVRCAALGLQPHADRGVMRIVVDLNRCLGYAHASRWRRKSSNWPGRRH